MSNYNNFNRNAPSPNRQHGISKRGNSFRGGRAGNNNFNRGGPNDNYGGNNYRGGPNARGNNFHPPGGNNFRGNNNFRGGPPNDQNPPPGPPPGNFPPYDGRDPSGAPFPGFPGAPNPNMPSPNVGAPNSNFPPPTAPDANNAPTPGQNTAAAAPVQPPVYNYDYSSYSTPYPGYENYGYTNYSNPGDYSNHNSNNRNNNNSSSNKENNLYVGNLDPRVTTDLLWEIFGVAGKIANVKIIYDKETGAPQGYGFVDFFDRETAEIALSQLNGCKIMEREVKVNWATSGSKREDTSNHFHVFVGDLSSEVNDSVLMEAFAKNFPSISDARVKWDHSTNKSRGYGFVAFRKKEDAERAIREMNGYVIGSRAVRINWANKKQPDQNPRNNNNNNYPPGFVPMGQVGHVGNAPENADQVSINYLMGQTSPGNTNVYIGNVNTSVTEDMIRDRFKDFGPIANIKMSTDKGYAFVRYHDQESAARSIHEMNGKNLGLQTIKCSWGRQKNQQGYGGNYGGYGGYGGYNMGYGQPYPVNYGNMPNYNYNYM
eukprot:TRINITY_DN7493_c0_g1_i1.p1 TRINITY_DN7493_c0_g1~~TRINITY_DN7493_c0_g1_i1.p1  ORF type:complete len:542 (+),score=128.34 TRINITY_DN7493_c0_g1_i1:163-1788(+)